jgi:glucose/arabinose dehydrogenase
MRGYILATTAAGLLAAAPLTAQATAAALPDTVPTQAGTLDVQRLAQLDSPWGMAYLPGGRLLITERGGRLRVFAGGQLSAPVTGLPDFAFTGQGGLLDVAVDPDVARNGLVYLYYVEDAEQQPATARETGDPRFGAYIDTTDAGLRGGAVARARLVGNELRDFRVIWRQTPKMIGRGHFAGRLLFAPDGKLFITSGDRQRFDPAQDLASNVGKMVRINPDGSIPADNPFVGRPGASGDVWSVGHRNQLGAAINPATGQLWIHEMGPAGGDEVNVVTPGRNYGWPRVSNGDNYDGSPIPDHVTSKEFETPAYSWTPSVSPSGMLFHSGRRFPEWRGNVLMGGLSSMALIRLTLTGNRVSGVETIAMGQRIRDVIEAPDGAVLLLVDGPKGELLRLTPRATGAARSAGRR